MIETILVTAALVLAAIVVLFVVAVFGVLFLFVVAKTAEIILEILGVNL